MPSKHIDDSTWRRVESETVKAVIATRTSLKDTEILKLLILKGLECITEDDYRQYLKEKGRD
ncbi:hypothetical protein BWQ95_22710 [Aeromonas hydrophila]|jgi:hypothetical protein|uniref:Repressor n=1 Tax=Aeromonas hydrophila TaxID=644 RepID=A0AAQ3CDY3_AERHY|nr:MULTISPECIES: hypothetical protein [Aeromonas]GKQ64657.1 hypothetical protein KAM338_48340 [Aeromonas caviae]MCV9383040.1 hypothetical protein [Aeromonas hydrophila]MDD9224091.1 hypothetical protein [Aeromonas hydrophila]ONG02128.1 hypothetical protein BWQ95_22710 [Aeromonas hydrophila]WEA32515.1 hypothetical protein PWO56_12160 [Aeromonas hydrophila]